MIPTLFGISIVAQLASVLTAYVTRTIKVGLRAAIATLAAPVTALVLTVLVGRISTGQPFNEAGPEYGVIVLLGAFVVAIANLAIALLYVPPLVRRIASDR
jgi:hypothetical protein